MTASRRIGWALRVALAALGGAYLVTILGISAGGRWTQDTPPAFRYFAQVACLFPNAARMAIEYRVEAWHCSEGAFRELDVRPYFPIHADNKESRLHRLGFFYRQERAVLEELERYVLRATDNPDIGGIRLVSVRHPLPPIDERPVPRFTRRPLAELPPETIHAWFYTPVSRREQNCRERR